MTHFGIEERAESGFSAPTCEEWGIVLAPGDSTEAGCVRVRLNTMQKDMDIFDSVPVLSFYGGGDYGAFFVPEEGDTVKVSFVAGDFLHPVITGCRFKSGSGYAKQMQDKRNVRKGIKLKDGKIEISGPEKMNWELDEEQEEIIFGDQKRENRMQLEAKDGKICLQAKKEILLQCGKSMIKLSENGTVSIKCEKLEVESREAKISAGRSAQVKGQELTLEGTTGLNVNGKSQIKVKSSGPVKISGAVVQLG